jgi:RNA polymerase-binding transcription factor DksA
MTDPVARKLRHDLATTLSRLRLHDMAPADVPSASGASITDLIDSAQAVEERELRQLTATRLVDRARRLRVALARVERGEYGTCEECGVDIAESRLAALPDVATCLPCQERRERLDASLADDAPGRRARIEPDAPHRPRARRPATQR